jgi:hypothetical protein
LTNVQGGKGVEGSFINVEMTFTSRKEKEKVIAIVLTVASMAKVQCCLQLGK